MPDAVGFICHPRVDIGHARLREARERLESRGYRVWTHCATSDEKPGVLQGELDGTKLLVSFGGDGTLLWTAQQAATAHVPLLGVNAGRLGFLTEVQFDNVAAALDRWAGGDFVLQPRPLLEAQVMGKPQRFFALNDAVVHKGEVLNLIRLDVTIDDDPAGRFDADGAVVSTPTGSTAYALSLGGPIVRPDARVLIFLPLNPHSLFNRAVVLPHDARVSIRLPEGSGLLSCDGQVSTPLEAGAEVQVALGRGAVELVRFDQKRNFFELLRQKLRWGQPLTDAGA